MIDADNILDLAEQNRLVSYARILCHGHPLLLTSFAGYLRRHEWLLSPDDLATLGRPEEYAAELNAETVDRLLATVGDDSSLELLYRLNLVIGTFPSSTAFFLAEVNPPVERPRQRLNAQIGLWLQRDAADRLAVSPLVKALGNVELTGRVRKDCWVALGEEVTQRRQVTTTDVSVGVTYFTQAESFEQAGILLLVALNTMRDAGIPQDPGILLSIWWDTPFPEAMPLGIRIYLRAMQLSVGTPLGRNPIFPARELLDLVRRATPEEGWAVLGAVALASSLISRFNFAGSCFLIQRALELFPGSRLSDGSSLNTELEMPVGFKAEWFVWWVTDAIETPGDLAAWLNLAASMPLDVRMHAFEGHLAESACLAIVNRIWLREAQKPLRDRHWRVIDATLESVAIKAREQIGSELLWGVAVRAQVIVRGEYQKRSEEARAFAEAALTGSTKPSDPRVFYLIEEEVGRLLLYAGQREAARTWLDRSLTHPIKRFPHQRMITLLHAAKAQDDIVTAVRLAEEAVSLVVPDNSADPVPDTDSDLMFLPDTERIRALGELALARWEAGDRQGSLLATERAAELLLSEPSPEISGWREAAVLLGQFLGHVLSASEESRLPEGVQPPASPDAKRGMFLVYDDRNAAPYKPPLLGLIASTLSDFAEMVREDKLAGDWALRAVDFARASGSREVLAVALEHAVLPLILSDRYGDGIEAGRESILTAYAVAHAIRTRTPGITGSILTTELSQIEELWRRLPPERQRESDANGAVIALVPALFRIATIAITDVERAADMAQEVSAACRIIAGSNPPAPELWSTAAEVFTQIFARRSLPGDLGAYGDGFRGKYENLISFLCYITRVLSCFVFQFDDFLEPQAGNMPA